MAGYSEIWTITQLYQLMINQLDNARSKPRINNLTLTFSLNSCCIQFYTNYDIIYCYYLAAYGYPLRSCAEVMLGLQERFIESIIISKEIISQKFLVKSLSTLVNER